RKRRLAFLIGELSTFQAAPSTDVLCVPNDAPATREPPAPAGRGAPGAVLVADALDEEAAEVPLAPLTVEGSLAATTDTHATANAGVTAHQSRFVIIPILRYLLS